MTSPDPINATLAEWERNLAQHRAMVAAELSRLAATTDPIKRAQTERNLAELGALVEVYEANIERLHDLRPLDAAQGTP